MSEQEILSRINELIKDYFSLSKEKFIPGKTKIPLNTISYNWEEVNEALESLLTTWVTMGKKVRRFENLFADYIGAKDAVMVNSGSSANLLALSVLTNPAKKDKINPRDEIITPAVTWATTVYPILNVNAVPVLVDVDIETCNASIEEIEKAITKKTKAIMPVHLLGNPCNMKEIMEIAEKHGLYVIEDACEAHGAEFEGKKVGSFGHVSTFSFFWSHHITTVEGGMVLSEDEEILELTRALRAFGWVRNLKDKENLVRKYSHIDPRFLFVNIGYNVRPTEIQGSFGIHQMKKLDNYIKIRRENAKFWNETLEKFSDFLMLPREREGFKHVYFGYPVTMKEGSPFTMKELTDHLEKAKIETRPIMVGNMTEQPSMKLFQYKAVGELPNSKYIMRNSFFFGNHQGIGEEERQYIADVISGFIRKRAKS